MCDVFVDLRYPAGAQTASVTVILLSIHSSNLTHESQQILAHTEVLELNRFVKKKMTKTRRRKKKKKESTEPSKEQINRNGTLKQT